MPTPERTRGSAPPSLTAHDLRRLAESADGLREGEVAIVYRRGGLSGDGYIAVYAADVEAADEVILRVTTRNVVAGRPKIAVEVKYEEGAGAQPPDGCDALFWSESAVEKFVLPYYWDFWPADKVAELRDSYHNDPDVVAIAHEPGSVPRTVNGDGAKDGVRLVVASKGAKGSRGVQRAPAFAFLSLEQYRKRRRR